MVKCECCGDAAVQSRIYRLSLDDDAEERRVCRGCFNLLMDTSKMVRMQSGSIAWDMATVGKSTIEIETKELWKVSK